MFIYLPTFQSVRAVMDNRSVIPPRASVAT
jgi:hypothetical protein